MIVEELEEIVEKVNYQKTAVEQVVKERFLQRLQEGAVTRDENPASHFCVFFLPFNPETHEVFLGHHKKAGLWLSPGGHIDAGETLLQALNREISEELGMVNYFSTLPIPFFLAITPIQNPGQSCQEHFDIWFVLESDGNDFKVDHEEFYETRWVSLDRVSELIKSQGHLEAVDIIKKMYT